MLLVFLVIVATLTPATIANPSNGTDTPLRVAAFNVQTFGVNKMSDSVVAKRIVEIIQRSDIILIQEVRDITGEALKTLKGLLGPEWDYIASERIGRTSYKEQYVFFYRPDVVTITGNYQYEDPDDIFEREPYVIEIQYFSSRNSEPRKMALLGLHSRPDDTPAELKTLSDIILYSYLLFDKSDGVVAMGDFNADCSYLNEDSKNSLDIFKAGLGFTSLVDESADTTVSESTDCAYDRVVTFGDVDARDIKIYNFQKEMELTEDQAKDVSDHYPIEFKLY